MSADDGAVDEQATDFSELRSVGQEFEESPEAAGLDPATEAVVDRIPGSELTGQIAPGNAGAGPVEQRLEEEAIREQRSGAALVLFGLLDERLEVLPEFVRKLVTHGILPRGDSGKSPQQYQLQRTGASTRPRLFAVHGAMGHATVKF